ncbi:MAG: nitrous oxide-stimulated promoter family protein [Promethearchaeota archaeon]
MNVNVKSGDRQLRKLMREEKTLRIMIKIYCNAHHDTSQKLCESCQDQLDYGVKRLHSCPQMDDKPTCASCKIHCYTPAHREAIREMMRYSGPRMTFRHPFLAFNHLFDLLKMKKEKLE